MDSSMRLAAALVAASGAPPIPAEWSKISTVMIRHLPNKVTQSQLLSDLNDTGFLDSYDFVYLPIDPDTNANKGYAFINFHTAALAAKCKRQFDGFKFCDTRTKKVVNVMPAALQ